jgi:cholesterol transport system auxiliary component
VVPRRKGRWQRLVAVLLALGVLMGCGAIFGRDSTVSIQTYVFRPRKFQQMPDAPTELVLLVQPVSSIGYESRRMSYTRRAYEQTFYAFSQWMDTPPRMLEPLVVQAMETSGLFAAVVDATSSVPVHLRLNLDLLLLQHEFQTQPSEGHLVVRAQINDVQRNRILGTRVFEVRSPAPSEDAYGGALAVNLAIEILLRDLVLWTREMVQAMEPPELSVPRSLLLRRRDGLPIGVVPGRLGGMRGGDETETDAEP